MKRPLNHSLLILLLSVIISTGCNKDKDKVTVPAQDEDNHHATTLSISFLEENALDPLTFTFKDTDGEGGNPPVIDEINLMPNRTYTAQIAVLDESKPDAPVALTGEIEEESGNHKFFFEISNINMTHEYKDSDDANLPLGLANQFTTDEAGSGTLKIILKHYHSTADKANDINGETDIEVMFNVVAN